MTRFINRSYKNEIIEKNLPHTFYFFHEVIHNPDLINEIPDGSEIEFVQNDIPVKEKRFKNSGKTQFFKENIPLKRFDFKKKLK